MKKGKALAYSPFGKDNEFQRRFQIQHERYLQKKDIISCPFQGKKGDNCNPSHPITKGEKHVSQHLLMR